MTKTSKGLFVIDRKLIFITGASRSGTTLLSFVLRNHDEIFGLKELQYFGEAWDPSDNQRMFSRGEAITAASVALARQDHGIMENRVGPEHRCEAAGIVDALGEAAADPAALFAAVVHQLAAAADKSIPCEQTPRYIFYARRLLELYPAAHVVHIVRDPRAVMASQKMRWRRRRLSVDGGAVSRYQSLRVWVNYHPYTVARLWSGATATALALAEHPRVTLVRFEQLLQEPEATVRLLCRRLGLTFDKKMLDVRQINSSHQSSAGGARRGLHTDAIRQWTHLLTPAEIAITESLCGDLMRRFGYECVASEGVGPAAGLGFRLSYLAHLAGVVLVNPRRAAVQAAALLRVRRKPLRPATTSATRYDVVAQALAQTEPGDSTVAPDQSRVRQAGLGRGG
jgi:omega-hydroxy-beta-dihydromenaquinone-9 sulfotransferase